MGHLKLMIAIIKSSFTIYLNATVHEADSFKMFCLGCEGSFVFGSVKLEENITGKKLAILTSKGINCGGFLVVPVYVTRVI